MLARAINEEPKPNLKPWSPKPAKSDRKYLETATTIEKNCSTDQPWACIILLNTIVWKPLKSNREEAANETYTSGPVSPPSLL